MHRGRFRYWENPVTPHMSVMWTALPEHDTQKLESDNDAVIFQWYAPKQQYK